MPIAHAHIMDMDEWDNGTFRYSEAYHRGSDGGVVLTEETDSFIIGDVVFVNGTKRGKIAFIGETNFAKGEWAGIVLDEPLGKNDGTVSGIRYFQCDPNHGTFTRLTRVTRAPMGYDGECGVHGATPPRCLLDRQRSPSPFHSKSPSPGMRTPTRVGSPSLPLKIGERVIVQSSTGTKRGILKFLGTTEFANGDWAGIELDQPVGKNDGSVGGQRYFTCRDRYGLFAPIHKVTSSPANRLPSSGLRRQGSRESMVSNLSSITSSTTAFRTVREVLKEKEKHLEQLMKERELDRNDTATANRRYDVCYNELQAIKSEFLKHKDESATEILNYKTEFNSLIATRDALKNALEEEKKKHEDILFDYEEEKIQLQGQVDSLSEANFSLDDKLKEMRLAREAQEQKIPSPSTEKKFRELEENFEGQMRKKAGEAKSLNEKILDLDRRVEEMSKEKSFLLDQLNTKEENLKDLSNKFESEVKSRENEIEKKDSVIGSYDVKIKELSSELEKKKNEFSSKSDLEEAANQKILTLESKLNEQVEKNKVEVDSLKQKLLEFDTQVKKAKEEISSLSTQIVTKEENHKDLKLKLDSQVSTLEKEIEKRELLLKSSAEKIACLSSEVEKKNLEFSSSKAALEAGGHKLVEQLEGKLRAEVEKHAGEMSNMNGKLRDLELKLEDAGKEKSSIGEQLQNCEESLRELKAKFESEMVKSTQEREALSRNYEGKVQGLVGEVEKKQKEMADLKHELETTSQKEIGKLQQKLSTVEKTKTEELNGLREQLTDLKGKLEEVNKMVEIKEAELAAAAEKTRQMGLQIEANLQLETKRLDEVKKNHDEEIKSYAAKLSMKESECAAFIVNLEEGAQTQVKDLENQLAAFEKTKSEEMRILKEKLLGLNEQVDLGKKNLNGLEEQLAASLSNFNSLKLKNAEDVEKFGKETADRDAKIQTSQVKITSLDAEIQKVKGESANLAQELEAVKLNAKDVESNSGVLLKKKEEEIMELSLKMQKLKGELEEAVKGKETLSEKLTNSEKFHVDLKEQMEAKALKDKKDREEIQRLNERKIEELAKEVEKRTEELTLAKTMGEKGAKEEILEITNKFSCELKGKDEELGRMGEKMRELERRAEEAKVENLNLTQQAKDAKEEEGKLKVAWKAKTEELVLKFNKMDDINKGHEERIGELVRLGQAKEEELARVTQESEERLQRLREMEEMEGKRVGEMGKKAEELRAVEERMREAERRVKDLVEEKVTMEENIAGKMKEISDNSTEDIKAMEKKLNLANEKSKMMEKNLESRLKEEQKVFAEKESEFKVIQKDLMERCEKLTGRLKDLEEQAKKKMQESSKSVNPPEAGDAMNMSSKENQDHHIKFLNSIIVDLQFKIEQLETRNSTLMNDMTSTTVTRQGGSSAQPAPRLYCDICEMFDTHDTEDCPTQSQYDDVEVNSVKKIPTEPRAYCDNCEVFGHDTADCDEGETF